VFEGEERKGKILNRRASTGYVYACEGRGE